MRLEAGHKLQLTALAIVAVTLAVWLGWRLSEQEQGHSPHNAAVQHERTSQGADGSNVMVAADVHASREPIEVSGNLTIRVFVRSSESGAPIEGAEVTVLDASGRGLERSFTDAAGSANLRLEGPKVDLGVIAGGYVPATFPDAAAGTEVDIYLDAESVIAGTVHPPSDAQTFVHVEPLWSPAARMRAPFVLLAEEPLASGIVAERVTTSPSGEFAIRGLRSGQWLVRATRQGWAPTSMIVTLSGASTRVELALGRTGAVHGRVVWADSGEAVARGALELIGRGDLGAEPRPLWVELGQDGSFSFADIPRGEHLLWIHTPNQPPIATTVLAAAPNEHSELIEIVRPRTIRAVLESSDGRPLSGARVAVHPWQLTQRSNSVGLAASAEALPFPPQVIVTGSDGGFVFSVDTSLSPVDVLVQLDDCPGWRFEDVEPGASEILRLRIPEQVGHRVQVVDSNGGLREALVTNEDTGCTAVTDAAGDASILVASNTHPIISVALDGYYRARQRFLPSTTPFLVTLEQAYSASGIAVDRRGVAIPGLPLQLVVDSEIVATAIADKSGRFGLNEAPCAFEIRSAANEWVVVETVRESGPCAAGVVRIRAVLDKAEDVQGAISGTAALPGGVEVPSLSALVWSAEARRPIPWGQIETIGSRFRISGLTSGEHSIELRVPGFGAQRLDVIASAGQEFDVGVVTFGETTRLRVQLTDSTGAPIKGAHVELLPTSPGSPSGAELILRESTGGAYSIPEAPRGSYELNVSHPELGQHSFQLYLVEVAQSEQLQLN